MTKEWENTYRSPINLLLELRGKDDGADPLDPSLRQAQRISFARFDLSSSILTPAK